MRADQGCSVAISERDCGALLVTARPMMASCVRYGPLARLPSAGPPAEPLAGVPSAGSDPATAVLRTHAPSCASPHARCYAHAVGTAALATVRQTGQKSPSRDCGTHGTVP